MSTNTSKMQAGKMKAIAKMKSIRKFLTLTNSLLRLVSLKN